jgi:DNA-binding MarR family transcriptional regulator
MPRLSKSDYTALSAFRKELRLFLRFSEQGARSVGITPQQHQVLLTIKGQAKKDWASIVELATAMQLRHNTLVELVDRCVKADLVRRDPSPDDRRMVRVFLTDHGEELLNKLSVKNLTELQKLREKFSELISPSDQ